MRIGVIFHRLGPYHCARLEAAARRCEVTAIELAAETGEYDWAKVHGAQGYTRVTLFPETDSRAAHSHEVQLRINDALTAARPEVVAVPGWSDPGAFAALLWCSENRTPAIVMSESTAHDEPRAWWKEFVKRRIVNLYSTALVGGRLHTEYLQQLGMPAERIFTGYDVVDNAHFAGEKAEKLKTESLKLDFGVSVSQRLSVSEIDSQLSTLNSQQAPYFLASARFIEKKNLPTLIRAYAQYRRLSEEQRAGSGEPNQKPWNLVILGDGPLRPALNSQLSTLNLHGYVLLPGFKQYDELPSWYARAGAFLHASASEQWGLVVNEAAAAGLPLIISNRCGCVPELVQESNGFTFDPTNEQELAERMVKMASLPAQAREQMGAASQRIVAQYDAASFGEGLARAAELAMGLPRKHAGGFDRLLLNSLIRR